jgi:16S rRNA (adenine1518-N6/adenine1519-N6)-dimethyltransferase
MAPLVRRRARAGRDARIGKRSIVNGRTGCDWPQARRRFAQHFLVDRAVIRRIASLVDPGPGEVVLEIGPGRGALTEHLAAAVPRLVAVEIDRDLVASLRARFAGTGLRLIEGDILRLDLGDILREEGGERLLLVGNLPYNITAPLLFHLLDNAGQLGRAVLMVQREVARRLVARPGSKDYSLLTVLLAMQAEVRVRLEVDRRAFRPVPRVDSTVVELRFVGGYRHPVRDREMFVRLVRVAFGQRRKMLRNALANLVASGARGELERRAMRAGVDLTRRPETLNLEEFARLSDAFVEQES